MVSSLLTLEVLFGEDQRRKITFDSKNKKIIRIGDNNWYINDGDGENESSNGTWFYPEKYFTISEGMIIRIGTTSFECKFI